MADVIWNGKKLVELTDEELLSADQQIGALAIAAGRLAIDYGEDWLAMLKEINRRDLERREALDHSIFRFTLADPCNG